MTSTSTRLTAPTPVRKNRRRIEPVTSTRSPARQDETVRRHRPDQTEQSKASTEARELDGVPVLGTTTRNVQSGSPLGIVLSSGSWETRPTNRTSLTVVSLPVVPAP